jgi:phenylacetate-CoA ligase
VIQTEGVANLEGFHASRHIQSEPRSPAPIDCLRRRSETFIVSTRNAVEPFAPARRDPAQKFWDPDLQTMDPERRRSLQSDRLRALVSRIFDKPVPLFQHKLKKAGIETVRDVSGVEDLERIPVVLKQDLRASEAEHPPIGDYRFTEIKDCIRLVQSSGTTGAPTTMIFTRRDLWIEHESASRGYWRQGYRPGMIATHAHPAYLNGGGTMVSGAYEYFGLVNLWVPPPETDALAELGLRAWMRFSPDIPFMGFSIGRYLEVAAKLGLDPERDVGLSMKGRGGPVKSRRMGLMTAGLECYSYLGGACGASPGAHINEDWAIVQAVDPETGRDVEEGEWGNLVVTTLDRDNGMLRYDLEEACAIDRARCPCGETTMRAFWGGRFKDLLSCQGRRFQAAEVGYALEAVEAVTKPSLEWVVVRPKDDRSRLSVRVELAAGDRTEAASRCAEAIRQALNVEADVVILGRGELPRSSYKAARVVD